MIIPIPTRNEVVDRLVKDENKAHTEALRRVSDALGKATSLPVRFTLADLGTTTVVQTKVVQAMEFAGWRCTPELDANKKLTGYTVE